MGGDLGFLPYTGQRPRAGQLAFVQGSPGNQVVSTGMQQKPMRAPTFVGGCVCTCPAAGEGLALMATRTLGVGMVLAVNVATKAIWQMFGQGQIWNPAGLAVDATTRDVWVLDNRTDSDLNDGYWIHHYEAGASGYERTEHYKVTVPAFSPARANPLSFLAGKVVVTQGTSPASYVVMTTGGAGTVHTIKRSGTNFLPTLTGGIVTIEKPVVKGRKYAIYLDTVRGMGLIEFNSADTITRIFEDTTFLILGSPKGLATVCQRLIVLKGLYTDLVEA